MGEYKGTETFQILVKSHEAKGILESWVDKNLETDLRFRRAKTKGHTVIETKDVLFANYIRNWYPGCQVNIKE